MSQGFDELQLERLAFDIYAQRLARRIADGDPATDRETLKKEAEFSRRAAEIFMMEIANQMTPTKERA